MPLADDGQGACRGADDDVRLVQVVGISQGRLPGHRTPLPATGPVAGSGSPPSSGSRSARTGGGPPVPMVSGAHQQHLGLGEIGEDTAGLTAAKGHRHRASADLGVGAHRLATEKDFWNRRSRGSFHHYISLLGVGVGLLDLPQDLGSRAPGESRATGHPHQVSHRFLVLVPVDGGEHPASPPSAWNRCNQFSTCPCPLLQAAIELGAVCRWRRSPPRLTPGCSTSSRGADRWSRPRRPAPAKRHWRCCG